MLEQLAVERHLERGKSLTVLEAWKKFGTTELRRIISRLRKRLDITDCWEEFEGKRYKRYFLKKGTK
jgi:hypothetical protein